MFISHSSSKTLLATRVWKKWTLFVLHFRMDKTWSGSPSDRVLTAFRWKKLFGTHAREKWNFVFASLCNGQNIVHLWKSFWLRRGGKSWFDWLKLFLGGWRVFKRKAIWFVSNYSGKRDIRPISPFSSDFN